MATDVQNPDPANNVKICWQM